MSDIASCNDVNLSGYDVDEQGVSTVITSVTRTVVDKEKEKKESERAMESQNERENEREKGLDNVRIALHTDEEVDQGRGSVPRPLSHPQLIRSPVKGSLLPRWTPPLPRSPSSPPHTHSPTHTSTHNNSTSLTHSHNNSITQSSLLPLTTPDPRSTQNGSYSPLSPNSKSRGLRIWTTDNVNINGQKMWGSENNNSKNYSNNGNSNGVSTVMNGTNTHYHTEKAFTCENERRDACIFKVYDDCRQDSLVIQVNNFNKNDPWQ